jgi:hypothetical protein
MSIWGGAVPSIRAAPSDFAVPAHDDLRVASRVQVRLPVFHDDPTHRDASSRTRSKLASASSVGSNDHRRPDPIRCETAELRGQVDSPRSLGLLQLLQNNLTFGTEPDLQGLSMDARQSRKGDAARIKN